VKTIRHLARKSRGLFGLVLAASLFMRLWVPTGWMPVAGPSGLHMELCSGWAAPVRHDPVPPAAMHAMDHHAHAPAAPEKHDPNKHPHQPCPYASLAMACGETGAPPSIVPPVFAALQPNPGPSSSRMAGLAAPPPPSTGPPAFA
jgi:hypothetical protein